MKAFGEVETICGIPAQEAVDVLRDYKSGKLRYAEMLDDVERGEMAVKGIKQGIEEAPTYIEDAAREHINAIKLEMRVIQDQIEREWNKA